MKTNDPKAVEIGQRIKQARLEADGMKQRELADLLGVTERSVIAYEQGDVVPYRFIRDLERILNTSAAWLLHGDAAGPDLQVREELVALREAIETLTQKIDAQK